MENNGINELIVAFKGYRDLISPIEQSLRDFSLAFDGIKGDIESLNKSFNGDVQGKFDKIYKELSSQAEKTKTLTAEIDRFMSFTSKYVNQVERFVDKCAEIENKIKVVDTLQNKADEQIEKLDAIIETKKKTYDIKQLEKNLENYNVSVQKISEFINKDVAETLNKNNENLNNIKDKNSSMLEVLLAEKVSIDNLIEKYTASNNLLKKVVENETVNEEYIFEILDKWAVDRRVKTKK